MKQPLHSQATSDTFLLGQAQAPQWEKAAEQCLQQIGYVPADATLGFVYVTDVFAGVLNEILEHFREETGIQHWVGTVGTGICGTGKEWYQSGAITALIASIPEQDFRILPSLTDGLAPLAELAPWAAHAEPRLGVIHGDPSNGSTPELIEAVNRHWPDIYLVGGLSSSESRFPQVADQVLQGGISGVLFSEQVPVVTGLSQGCTPIATKHTITGCNRNVLTTLDDRPALDVFYEDIGEILARDLNRVAGYIFAGLPISHSDTGDYLVRNLVGVDTKNKLLAIGDTVTEGQTLQFCRRDGTTAWEDLDRMLADLRKRVGSRPIRGGLYYSCLGRGQNLFGQDSDELRAIRKELGDFPLVGFFANGEIFNGRLYGYTGVLTLFL